MATDAKDQMDNVIWPENPDHLPNGIIPLEPAREGLSAHAAIGRS
jgi:hypothetical protein